MSCKTCLGTAFLIGSILVCAGTMSAAGKKVAPKADPGLAAVEKVLRAEVAGPVDRREQLRDVFERQVESPAARWQAGFVRLGSDWLRFDKVDQASSTNSKLAEYRERRESAQPTAAAQLDLADWCRAHLLFDQERAHLGAALELGAGDAAPVVMDRLGYGQVAGQRLNPEQLLEWREMNRQAKESLKKWEPQLERFVDRLSGSRSQRETAMAGLKKIAEPAAIPAIEYVLSGNNEDLAVLAVELFRQIDGYESAVALARQAVFSPWRAAREAARDALRGRPLDQFVPDLMGLLSIPVSAKSDFYTRQDRPGVLFYNLVLARETENQFQVRVLTTADYTLQNQVELNIGLRTGIVIVRNGVPQQERPRFANDWRRSMSDHQRPREEEIIRETERLADVNQRVTAVLTAVSGQDTLTSPRDWWKWWADFSDLEAGQSKAVVIVKEEESVGSSSPPRISYRPSCFAAGTPVWTETGSVPIERIRIGDRVLAQDIQTGELAYRPVLETTVRPPKELTTLRFSDETIICTGGHRFWCSSSGWIKARDLTSQVLLHTVTGNTPVFTAAKGETAETYNLVVADFHTYFVGKTGVLCQDLLPPQRTNNIVPGLSRKHAVANASQ